VVILFVLPAMTPLLIELLGKGSVTAAAFVKTGTGWAETGADQGSRR